MPTLKRIITLLAVISIICTQSSLALAQAPDTAALTAKLYLPFLTSPPLADETLTAEEVALPEGESSAPAEVSAAAVSEVLLPTSYVTTKGASGGQPVGNLAVQDQTGTQDDWNKYVEFWGSSAGVAYSGYRSYILPTRITPASITGLQVKISYKGPVKSFQTWTWSIYNWSSKKWVNLGTNPTTPPWQWLTLTFNVPGTRANYVNSTTREMRVRTVSNNAADDMDLDYEALLLTHNSPPPPSTLRQKLAIPSYFYPGGSYWPQLESGAPTVGLAIINPNSGVGTALDPNYVNQTNRTKAKGIVVLGYVYTSYGQRSAQSVKDEINQYYAWYGVDGIFFDEASNDCANLAYYQDLYTYVKGKGGVARVALNPGINTGECYMNASDLIITFEDTYANYLNWQPSAWEANYAPDRFWHLVIETTQANMPNAIALSKSRRAGWVYVTPDTLANNPWDSLPVTDYWNDELYRASH